MSIIFIIKVGEEILFYPLYHTTYETFYAVSELMDPGFVVSSFNQCDLHHFQLYFDDSKCGVKPKCVILMLFLFFGLCIHAFLRTASNLNQATIRCTQSSASRTEFSFVLFSVIKNLFHKFPEKLNTRPATKTFNTLFVNKFIFKLGISVPWHSSQIIRGAATGPG